MEEVLKKWDRTGLLQGLGHQQKVILAYTFELLTDTYISKKPENDPLRDNTYVLLLPIIRRAMSEHGFKPMRFISVISIYDDIRATWPYFRDNFVPPSINGFDMEAEFCSEYASHRAKHFVR